MAAETVLDKSSESILAEATKHKSFKENRWFRAAVPALLIHCSIGTVYCWSVFKADIATYMGYDKSLIEWGFSLAIFFLGMSAAFGGAIVEQDIKRSSLIAAICFSVGMLGTGFSIWMKWLPGIYIFYGCIMGIGLGIGYLTPVKCLMLWFYKNKGLGAGLSIAGFGLAKMIASPVMTKFKDVVFADKNAVAVKDAAIEAAKLAGDNAAAAYAEAEKAFVLTNGGIYKMFFALGIIYFVMMMAGHFMIRKPAGWVEPHGKTDFKPTKVLKNPVFIGIWIMFYINITCGLAIISQEKDILHELVDSAGVPILSAGAISILLSVDAFFNAGGRLGFASLSDRLKDRNSIYKVIFCISIAISGILILTKGIQYSIVPLVVILFFLINAGYGGGFSTVPALLSDRFGMKTISTVHGLTLSAWAIAGLSGNQLATFIVNLCKGTRYEHTPYAPVLWVTTILYAVALCSSIFLVKPGKFGED